MALAQTNAFVDRVRVKNPKYEGWGKTDQARVFPLLAILAGEDPFARQRITTPAIWRRFLHTRGKTEVWLAFPYHSPRTPGPRT